MSGERRSPVTSTRDGTEAGSMIQCRGVAKRFGALTGKGETVALSGIDLDVRRQEFITIIGPSGCGKSTLLNMIAGFERPTEGEILVDGIPVEGPSPERGVVFQEFALFPWLSVESNTAYGLRERGVSRQDRRRLVEEWLERVGLTGFGRHYPNQLSGGMKQRVALARVLINDPKILLMDEPFGALDEQRRVHLQDELLRIWEVSRKTALFVTHSIEEAIVLADRVVVLAAQPGRLNAVIRIPLSRPRDRTSDEFNAIRRQLAEFLFH